MENLRKPMIFSKMLRKPLENQAFQVKKPKYLKENKEIHRKNKKPIVKPTTPQKKTKIPIGKPKKN